MNDEARSAFEDAGARPDFLYSDHQVAIFIDGPAHDDRVRAWMVAPFLAINAVGFEQREGILRKR